MVNSRILSTLSLLVTVACFTQSSAGSIVGGTTTSSVTPGAVTFTLFAKKVSIVRVDPSWNLERLHEFVHVLNTKDANISMTYRHGGGDASNDYWPEIIIERTSTLKNRPAIIEVELSKVAEAKKFFLLSAFTKTDTGKVTVETTNNPPTSFALGYPNKLKVEVF